MNTKLNERHKAWLWIQGRLEPFKFADIKAYMGSRLYLRSILRWAVKRGLLSTVQKSNRGRITYTYNSEKWHC